MDSTSDLSRGGRPPRKELQGPRPAPLRVRKDSHKIKKPPVAPQAAGHYNQQLPPQPPREPVIIYTVSPKVIHTNPNDFMTLVQRLTGPDSKSSASASSSFQYASTSSLSTSSLSTSSSVVVASSASSSSSSLAHHVSGAISPAARFASIEMTKMPLESKKFAGPSGAMEGQMMEVGDHGTMQGLHERTMFFPGILSPGPGSLPPISPNLFSPYFQEPSNVNFNHGFSGVQHGNNRSYIDGSYMPSPFSATFVSPSTVISPSSLELLHRIMNS